VAASHRRYSRLDQYATPKQYGGELSFVQSGGDGKNLPPVSIPRRAIFGASAPATPFLEITDWSNPITYFVGRNGSGKTRTAQQIAKIINATPGNVAKVLSTDRLSGLVEPPKTHDSDRGQLKGFALDDPQQRATAKVLATYSGIGLDDIYTITDHPEIWIRVAAFMRRALHRFVEIRERNGRIDPYIVTSQGDYSLLRDEGHGLREILILLTAAYRRDWNLLIVDEPELHLHPALARMWLSVLESECRKTGRNAIIITHEPDLLKPQTVSDLSAVWFFNGLNPSIRVSDLVLQAQFERVNASLRENPTLIGQLVFSPRPVLVEGLTDSAALSVAISRLYSDNPEVPSQTDFVVCGGCSKLALWFEIARKMRIDVRAVADLDALFNSDIQRAMDGEQGVRDSIAAQFMESSPAIKNALAPISQKMGEYITGETNPRSKAGWLAERLAEFDMPTTDVKDFVAQRATTLLEILKDNSLWLHRHGALENVLDVDTKDVPHAREGAGIPGPIDEVAEWAAFQFDLRGDISDFLRSAVERIAQGVQAFLGLSPTASTERIAQSFRPGDKELVDIVRTKADTFRLTVKQPEEFVGHWIEFSRGTAPNDMNLNPPD
jgi:energy-coupling factor transporter ATP-binding protein EcfA2